MNFDSQSIALAKIQKIYMKKQPNNVTELIDFAHLQERIKVVTGQDRQVDDDTVASITGGKQPSKSQTKQKATFKPEQKPKTKNIQMNREE